MIKIMRFFAHPFASLRASARNDNKGIVKYRNLIKIEYIIFKRRFFASLRYAQNDRALLVNGVRRG